MKLSDIYISEKGSPQIWNEPALVQAYINYFLPLNCVRAMAVLNWAKQLGFADLFSEVIEFGSGPGTLQIAAHHMGHSWDWHCLEANKKAFQLHQDFSVKFGMKQPIQMNSWPKKPNALFASSYVLNETDFPTEAFAYDSILIIEPSTQSATRKLMELRQKLIHRGYNIWGPCTHQGACPLLTKSKKDWCHFRIHWDQPGWFKELESHIPMKNKTLTLSYLLASRNPLPPSTRNHPARIIGDTLYEKGKVRQALCRGERREFLSWLKRSGEPKPYVSGELIDLPESLTIKGNEIRMNSTT